MTSYWDNWAALLYEIGQKGQVSAYFVMAIKELIEMLHSYDHAHGGYELVLVLEKNRYLEKLLKLVQEELKDQEAKQ